MDNPCEKKLFNLMYAQEWHLDRLYAEYASRFGVLFQNASGPMLEIRKKQMERILLEFNSDLNKLLEDQINKSFSISNSCQDEYIKDYTKGLGVSEDQLNKMFAKNPGAASAFANRASAGLKLSERVWALTKQTEDSMNIILESGVLDGRTAPELARDLKQYLKNPDKRFRRIRNEAGKLTLSKPASEYHPGQGVYRSSYKNALRLSRTEVNMAYRSNDFERRKTMPFVMGQRIELSAAHTGDCICNHLTGTYPKEFKFVGWHPMCICTSVAVQLPREKFKEYLGGGEIDRRHLIKRIPNKAFKYLNDNAATIKGYKNPPYFIKDNFKNTRKGFALKSQITKNQ